MLSSCKFVSRADTLLLFQTRAAQSWEMFKTTQVLFRLQIRRRAKFEVAEHNILPYYSVSAADTLHYSPQRENQYVPRSLDQIPVPVGEVVEYSEWPMWSSCGSTGRWSCWSVLNGSLGYHGCSTDIVTHAVFMTDALQLVPRPLPVPACYTGSVRSSMYMSFYHVRAMRAKCMPVVSCYILNSAPRCFWTKQASVLVTSVYHCLSTQ